jgi:aminopeptidase N
MTRYFSAAVCLALATFVLGAGQAMADTYPRQPAVDALHYRFELTLSDTSDEVSGKAVIDVRFLDEGVTSLALDLTRLDPASGKGMRVEAVSSGDGAVPFVHERDRLTLTVASPPAKGERRRFEVTYRGVPAGGMVIGPNKHGDRTFFTDNWPNKARHWLPTIDHPSDKATCEMVVDAPAHYQVVSNGLLVEETDLPAGRRRTHWKQSVPIADWLITLGVAPFAVQHLATLDGVPIQTWVYRQDRDAGFSDFAEPTADVLDFFSRRIGPYAYEKLANVQSNSVTGAMESATAIFYDDDSVSGTGSVRWRNVVIHEIAHQWFGNSVTERDWDDVWLSEGFATYFTLLYIEHAHGRDAFVSGLEDSRRRVLEFDAKRPEYRIVHDNLADMRDVLTPQIYQKGAWVLHMLRTMVGDVPFWRGIREYYARYKDRNATTADFRQVMAETSGMDLEWFFEQWLYRGGVPKVIGRWSYDTATRSLVIDLEQTQPGPPYRLRVDIGVTDRRGTRVEQAELAGSRQTLRIAADDEPSEVVLDPAVRTLAAWSVNKATR